MGEYTASDFLEIYHTGSTVEAQKILDVLLVPANIEAVIHDRANRAFPTPSSSPNAVAIAVPFDQRQEAIKILREAIESGYLDPEGELVADTIRA
jgi:hypothetical protein